MIVIWNYGFESGCHLLFKMSQLVSIIFNSILQINKIINVKRMRGNIMLIGSQKTKIA